MRVILLSIIMAIFSLNANALTFKKGDVLHEGKTYFCASPKTEIALFANSHRTQDYAGVVNRCFYYVWNQYVFYIPFNDFIHKHKTDRIDFIKERIASRITLLQNQTASLGGSFSYRETLPEDVRYVPNTLENIGGLDIDDSVVNIERVLETVQATLDSDSLSIDDIQLPDDITAEELQIIENIVDKAVDGESILKEIDELASANGVGELAGGEAFDEMFEDFAEEVVGDIGIDKVADETLTEIQNINAEKLTDEERSDFDIKDEDK